MRRKPRRSRFLSSSLLPNSSSHSRRLRTQLRGRQSHRQHQRPGHHRIHRGLCVVTLLHDMARIRPAFPRIVGGAVQAIRTRLLSLIPLLLLEHGLFHVLVGQPRSIVSHRRHPLPPLPMNMSRTGFSAACRIASATVFGSIHRRRQTRLPIHVVLRMIDVRSRDPGRLDQSDRDRRASPLRVPSEAHP